MLVQLTPLTGESGRSKLKFCRYACGSLMARHKAPVHTGLDPSLFNASVASAPLGKNAVEKDRMWQE